MKTELQMQTRKYKRPHDGCGEGQVSGVHSSPKDLMASTNSERAEKGCTEPRTINLESRALETQAHCSKPRGITAVPGLVVPARDRWNEDIVFDHPHAVCADTRSSSANSGRRWKRAKIRPSGGRHIRVEPEGVVGVR